jgi:hypothetical protein
MYNTKMPLPRFEVPTGTIDGINRVFSVSQSYRPGTTAVFLNGLLLEKSLDDGWVESNPLGGEVELKEAPRWRAIDSDVVQVFYIDTSPFSPQEILDVRLFGFIKEMDEIDGIVRSEGILTGILVEEEDDIRGLVVDQFMVGQLIETDIVQVVVRCCE